MKTTEGKKVIITALLLSEVTRMLTTKPITKENAIKRSVITLPTPDLLRFTIAEKASAILNRA